MENTVRKIFSLIKNRFGNVENKSSATIRSEITKQNVVDALGYTPGTSSTEPITYTLSKEGSTIKLTSSSGTSSSVTDSNTTYGAATSSALGLVKSGTDITVDANGNVSVNDDSHNHVISNVDGLQSALDGKAASSHTHDDRYYTESETDTKLNNKLNSSLKGVANGLAELDSNGKVPSSQLPSYVDDVIEGYYYNSKFYKESAHTNVITGETGKIYMDLSTNKTYRWSGSTYAEISPSLALGETSSTAYRGDRGKIAYDHSQTTHAPSNAEANQNAFSNIIVGSTTIAADSKTDSLTLVAGDNVTITPDATNDKVTIAATDTTYGVVSNAGNGLAPATNLTNPSYPNAAAHVLATYGGITGWAPLPDNAFEDTVTTVSTTGSGNAITSISASNGAITATKGSTFLTAHPSITKSTNTTSSTSPSHGGSFTVVDSVTQDTNGHITKVNTKTVKLPSASSYTLPTASSSTLGGVKTTSTVTSTSGLTACPIISGVPYYKDTNTTYSLSDFGLTATATELNYCDGVTSNIQTQLNGKAATHTHPYLSTSGGTASGDINIVTSSATNSWFRVANSENDVHFGVASNGTKGIYNNEFSTWMIYSVDSDNSVYVGSILYAPYGLYTNLIGSKSYGGSIDVTNYIKLYNTQGYAVSIYESRFAPQASDSNKITLGDSNSKWKQLFAGTTTISTSDRNLKDNITTLSDKYKQLFMKLIPVSFTLIDGDSGRTHIGFISQDVEDAMSELGMTGLDFAGFCKDKKKKVIIEKRPLFDKNGEPVYDEDGKQIERDEEVEVLDLDENGDEQYIYSLRYSEFIGLIAAVLQDNINDFSSLKEEYEQYKKETEDRFKALEERLVFLEQK